METMTQTSPLTSREHDIVRLVARGHMNRQIAEELRISEQTVKNQLTTIFQKVGVRSRVQLAIHAVHNGLS
jgi:DNA-binding NarL/FixJ family response regulator